MAIIACGAMVYASLVAAERLARKGIEAMVINLHTIKPIDRETVIEAAQICGAVVTAEEHQVMGGMGSAVAEVLSEACPVPIQMVGIMDSFGESGEPGELMQKYGLTPEHVVTAAEAVLASKAAGAKQ